MIMNIITTITKITTTMDIITITNMASIRMPMHEPMPMTLNDALMVEEVTNWQILLFGLTGGLIPCPAAITVLLICIQLKALTLGATLVVSFSIGLALTLITVGVGAAISVQQVAKRWSGFNTLAKRAPYFSSLLIGLVGVYMGVHGFMA
ncbi:nickel/cobalt efflux transporter [Escherichia coli]